LVSDFYDHPDLYDVLLPAEAHVPFYVDLARQQAGAVVELACGTGQLTIPVAVLGLPVVVTTTTFGRLWVEGTFDYDPVTQVNRGTWHVSTADHRDAWIVPMVLRSIFPQELPLLISAAGFELIGRFGDLSRAPFGPGSRAQVCLCRRQS
jgi:hypothetical protein